MSEGLEKLPTGIPGFDHVSLGGLPCGRSTLVAGSAGAAKTVFCGHFLAGGIQRGEPGVFVTFEEPAEDLRRNLSTLGWDIERWEREGSWRFVDASPVAWDAEAAERPYDFETLRARIGHAVDHTAAARIVLDSVGAVFSRFGDDTVVRAQLRQLAGDLRRLGLTLVLTAETEDPDVSPSRYGVEEFVADNVVVLRNVREEEKRRRTLEVLKMRGAMHRKGEYPFTVQPGRGIVVIPLSVIELTQRSTDARISSGNAELDELCAGGFFRDSIVLASGATGTGKTLMVTEFMSGGAAAGDRCLLFAFEESRDQIFRNAEGWGRDFRKLEASGLLRVEAAYPEVASLEDHLVHLKDCLEEFGPARIAIDSLSALERVGSAKAFREFIIGLTSFVKAQQVAALFTATTSTLAGGGSVTEGHISTLTDSIILLRYVETAGSVRRAMTVLKMRGSPHDRGIREYTIDGAGLHIGAPFRDVSGILSGHVVSVDRVAGPLG